VKERDQAVQTQAIFDWLRGPGVQRRIADNLREVIDRCGLGKVTQAADVFGLRPGRLGQEGVVDPVTRHKDADDLAEVINGVAKGADN
jgi:hypothetical protein